MGKWQKVNGKTPLPGGVGGGFKDKRNKIIV